MGCPTSKVDTQETGERQSAVERVSVCSEVLQDLVGASGIFSPLLQRIRDAYDQRLQLVLSRASTSDLKRTGDTRPGVERPRSRDGKYTDVPHPDVGQAAAGGSHGYILSTSPEVYQLRKRLHALEVQCRVKLQQNERCVYIGLALHLAVRLSVASVTACTSLPTNMFTLQAEERAVNRDRGPQKSAGAATNPTWR